MSIVSINPATGKEIKQYTALKEYEVDRLLTLSNQVFESWRQTGFSIRSSKMKRAAGLLRERSADYAKLMASEMGKPVKQGRSEIEKCAWLCEFYAEKAEGFLRDENVQIEGVKSYVSFQPLGIILAVMPWNFPFWQVFRAAVPAMMAGNAVILKHASNVPECAAAIEDVFLQSGFPAHLFKNFLIENKTVSKILENPNVRAVTLTGSTPAGKAVASKAGEMLKKSVLELGGSDPCVILEDADLTAAAKICASSRLINAGQSCIAAKRFIVVESVRPQFEELLMAEMKKYRIDDPLQDDAFVVGPMAREDLRDDLHRQVVKSVQKGARVLLGGSVPDLPGAFYPPTILTNVKKGMPVYDEETFGPVAAVISAKDEEEALLIANDTVFGLGAAVFTADPVKGESIARNRLSAGSCFVNDFVKSDPRLPFGGIKESGYGRELGIYGIREFVNVKTVYINQSS